MKRQRGLVLLALGCLLLAWPPTAMAHSGAPYPVLLEEPVGPYVVSALADPDVGTGTLYVQVALPDESPAPAGTEVTLWTRPEDGHTAETAHQARRQETRYGERFVAEVPFDAKGVWHVRLAIAGSAGQGEHTFPLEVTPKGFSWLVTLACLLPFVALGALWLRASRRQGSSQ
jgi:hypothetical protein